MEQNHDHLERRCPRLGGLIPFGYCRKHGGDGLPCGKLLDCWWEYFDIQAYVDDVYPEEVIDKIFAAKPKPKITSLIDLIEAARKRTETS